MKERGILFSAPMVRAILAGRKTQTRRVITHTDALFADAWAFDPERGDWEIGIRGDSGSLASVGRLRCPYGAPGDRLWVRETWRLTQHAHDAEAAGMAWALRGPRYEYRADPAIADKTEWKPSIHMPRGASRITLEVTQIRVERLHDISEEDARAEGVTLGEPLPAVVNGERGTVAYFDARTAFCHLWNQINGERAPWADNCWVWVISFKRVEKGTVTT